MHLRPTNNTTTTASVFKFLNRLDKGVKVRKHYQSKYIASRNNEEIAQQLSRSRSTLSSGYLWSLPLCCVLYNFVQELRTHLTPTGHIPCCQGVFSYRRAVFHTRVLLNLSKRNSDSEGETSFCAKNLTNPSPQRIHQTKSHPQTPCCSFTQCIVHNSYQRQSTVFGIRAGVIIRGVARNCTLAIGTTETNTSDQLLDRTA